MDNLIDHIVGYAHDDILFWVIQSVLILICITSIVFEFIFQTRAGRGGATITVKRSEKSMNLFYGTYGATNGLLVAICLTVEVATGYRIFWIILDTLITVYLFLFNPWLRNKIVSWTIKLKEIEKR